MMLSMGSFLQGFAMILIIVLSFNLIVFVHELGHFLAAKWRGLHVDRFQIWFGRPIWKKEYKGVQYGLGWIPAGGFVSLPQMAPMEAIEGGERTKEPLGKITPLDKIIVAFAGPLFSLLLAFAAALVVWKVGKPKDMVPTQVVGQVMPGSAAEKAGMLVGDEILKINGVDVTGFYGTLHSIAETIVLSEGDKIVFLVKRPGIADPLVVTSDFDSASSKWFERRPLRTVGIKPKLEQLVVMGLTENGPAALAGVREGDVIKSINGRSFLDTEAAVSWLKAQGTGSVELDIERGEKTLRLSMVAKQPREPKETHPLVGIRIQAMPFNDMRMVYPTPMEQVVDSLDMMWVTLSRLVSPKSNVGVDHLSGPVGIAKIQFRLLQMDDGWMRVLAFLVVFNVNLAVMNMLPIPVLDGGHIVLAILEKIAGRPVKAKFLEVMQTACAITLMGLMLYVTSKDVGEEFGSNKSDPSRVVFDPPVK